MYPAPGIHIDTVPINCMVKFQSSTAQYEDTSSVPRVWSCFFWGHVQLIQVVLVLDIMLKMQNKKTDHQQAVHCNEHTVDTSNMWERPPPTRSSIYSISHPRTRYAFGEWLYPAPHVARARRQPAPRSIVAKSAKFPWVHFFLWQNIHEFYGSRCGSHLCSSKWINTSQN